MLQRLHTKGQLLLMVALGSLAQNYKLEGIHYVYPKNFSYGENSVDEHSNITWGKFGMRAVYSSNIEDCTSSDLLVHSVSSLIINTVQAGKLPGGLVARLMTGTLNIDENDEYFKELMSNMSGVMALFVLWFSLALTVPWVGICVFCARKYGLLGGIRCQKYDPKRNWKRKEQSFGLLFCTIFILYVLLF